METSAEILCPTAAPALSCMSVPRKYPAEIERWSITSRGAGPLLLAELMWPLTRPGGSSPKVVTSFSPVPTRFKGPKDGDAGWRAAMEATAANVFG